MKGKKAGIRKYETGNPYLEENRVEDKLIEGDVRTKTIYRILDWYKEGLLRFAIIEILREEKTFSDGQIDDLLNECSGIVYEQFSTKSASVIGLHLKRYDKQINSLLNKDYNRYEMKIRFKMKSIAFMNALDTLYQKEKLLNLHSKQTIIRFNQRNNINVVVPEKKAKYDLSTLTLEEKIDFLALVEKCSPRNNVNTGVILRPKEVVVEETIDIDHVEEVNIDKIKQENVEGVDVFPEKPPLTLFELKERIAKTLQAKAAEAFKNAGSKTIDNERTMQQL